MSAGMPWSSPVRTSTARRSRATTSPAPSAGAASTGTADLSHLDAASAAAVRAAYPASENPFAWPEIGLPFHHVGEIWLHGANMGIGYWGRARLDDADGERHQRAEAGRLGAGQARPDGPGAVERLKRSEKPAVAEPSNEEKLLAEIRDLLKQKPV